MVKAMKALMGANYSQLSWLHRVALSMGGKRYNSYNFGYTWRVEEGPWLSQRRGPFLLSYRARIAPSPGWVRLRDNTLCLWGHWGGAVSGDSIILKGVS